MKNHHSEQNNSGGHWHSRWTLHSAKLGQHFTEGGVRTTSKERGAPKGHNPWWPAASASTPSMSSADGGLYSLLHFFDFTTVSMHLYAPGSVRSWFHLKWKLFTNSPSTRRSDRPIFCIDRASSVKDGVGACGGIISASAYFLPLTWAVASGRFIWAVM